MGANLVPRLLAEGYPVRCLVRDPDRLNGRVWHTQVEVVRGDIVEKDILQQAMKGVSTAYYLVHNMTSGRHYEERELQAARLFAAAAAAQGVEHIIYLGGLADPNEKIGRHMRSRLKTGDVLREGSVPVTEFRASLIIGSGSISFEMIRYLTEQFPLLMGPRWVANHAQPIAVQNVLDYLLAALKTPACRGKVYEIGGEDTLTYAQTMLVYARLRGLKRWMLSLPVILVWLMASVVYRLAPIPYNIARALIDGMRSDSVVRDQSAGLDFPHVQCLGYQAAVCEALDYLSPDGVEVYPERITHPLTIKREGFFIDYRQICLEASPQAVYGVVPAWGEGMAGCT